MKNKINHFFTNPFILAVFSAVLLRLSYPKFNFWFLAWIAFVPLLIAMERQSLKKVFLISFLSGTLFFILTIFWLTHVTVSGMVVLSAYLGLYVVLFSLGFWLLKDTLTFWHRLFFGPAWWVVLEFLRAHFLTGFPWALLAYSQSFNPPAIQIADVLGAYGVSFFVMFTNIFIFEVISFLRNGPRLRYRQVFIPLFIILFWLAYGSYRVGEDPKKFCPFKVAVVQGNIPQELKWVPRLKEKIFKKYQLLTEIVALKQEPDLVIWPETAYPDYLELGINEDALKAFTQEIQTPLLVGSIRLKHDDYFNSAILFLSSGQTEGVYDKIHLVPFGEYIPWRRFLSFLETWVPIADFAAGKTNTIFSISNAECPNFKFGVLVCFEDIFSDLAVPFVQQGADVLVNITNDAWFGDTASPYQHMQASVLRAVENRVFVVRAANTGISCIIDDAGRVLGSVKNAMGKETFLTGFHTGFVYKTGRRSLYTKIGDVFTALCALYVLGIGFLFLSTKKVLKSAAILILLLGTYLMLGGPYLHAEDQRKEIALHYYRGVVNYEAGRYENAITEFQTVAALDPYYKDTQKYIEDCIKILEQYRQNVLQEKVEKTGERKGFDLYFLGKSYYEKGEYRRALEVFKTLVSKDPSDRFAQYYAQLCQNILSGRMVLPSGRKSPQEEAVEKVRALEKETSYVKSDIREQENVERFLAKKAERKALREELIDKKEKELQEQEELLEEERQDYLAQAKIAERVNRIRRETEKWKSKKERLAFEEPGVPASLSDFPVYIDKAESYYMAMKEALRMSRWHAAGLNAISASINYGDAILIYFYGVKSASPAHENITRLLLSSVKRSDVQENVFHLRSILNLKKIIEEEDRPMTRSEALFLVEHTERITEWCKSMLP